MKEEDYPALWKSSTAAAKVCQERYFQALKFQLGLLTLIAVLAAWAPGKGWVPVHAGIVAVLMFVAMMLRLLLRLRPMDDSWFRARAFAENAKAAAWRFMMKPASATVDDKTVEKAFLNDLQAIRGRFPQVEKYLSEHEVVGPEITSRMREVRQEDVPGRLAKYVADRVRDQIAWYGGKAKESRKSDTTWFVVILLVEGVAFGAAVVRIVAAGSFNPTGALAATAACMVAWTQAKRFADLANTYGVACRDLNSLLTRADHVQTEEDLANYVEEVEAAISREHRLWIDRRVSLRTWVPAGVAAGFTKVATSVASAAGFRGRRVRRPRQLGPPSPRKESPDENATRIAA